MADPLQRWVDHLAGALELDPSVLDRDVVLDLAREAAHGVARPAAPLTTFLVGLAAGRAGGSAADIESAVREAIRLASEWDD